MFLTHLICESFSPAKQSDNCYKSHLSLFSSPKFAFKNIILQLTALKNITSLEHHGSGIHVSSKPSIFIQSCDQ